MDGVIAALRGGANDYLLKPVNADLLRAVIARVRKVQQLELRTRHAERLAAIGQMATGLAHESRNALQRIGASAEMLELEFAGYRTALKFISRIQQAQIDIRKLLDEVRNYAAPILLDRSVCRVTELWREAWELLLISRQGRDAELREHIGAADLKIEAIDSVWCKSSVTCWRTP